MFRTFLLFVLFLTMLLTPDTVFEGACSGLLLWYQIIIPTLFPFLVITGLLLRTDGLTVISRLLYHPFRFLFGTSVYGSFAVLSGFLCGYPMGSKIIADLLREGKISYEEARHLLSFCNNASPSFLVTFLVFQTLKRRDLLFPVLFLLLGTPIVLSLLTRIWNHFFHQKPWTFSAPSDASPTDRPSAKRLTFPLLESCILNSSETLVKVGGYLILFSILLALLSLFPSNCTPVLFLKASLEMTNGILLLSQNITDSLLLYPSLFALTAFGGWCSVAQTQSMIAGTPLRISAYIRQKLTAALAVSLITILYLNFS